MEHRLQLLHCPPERARIRTRSPLRQQASQLWAGEHAPVGKQLSGFGDQRVQIDIPGPTPERVALHPTQQRSQRRTEAVEVGGRQHVLGSTHHGRSQHRTVLDRLGEVPGRETGNPVPQGEVGEVRALRVQSQHLLDRRCYAHIRAAQQQLAFQHRASQRALVQHLWHGPISPPGAQVRSCPHLGVSMQTGRPFPAGRTAPLDGWCSGGWNQKSMPPMPPVGSPPAGAAAFSGLSATTASVVRNRAAIEAAFCNAERVTFTGSLMPAASMSPYSPVAAFRPWPCSRLRTRSTTTPPSRPALMAICLSGPSSADFTICAPTASSPVRSSLSKADSPAWMSATPPPATMPSSTAALALRTASSMRCLRSLSSTSVAAPARMTATPPANLASRSCSFSRS